MFKDIMNLVAGEIFEKANFNTAYLEQQMMTTIVLIGSNPWFNYNIF